MKNPIKEFLNKYFPVIPVGLVLGSVMFSHSCANTTTPPTGGPKDTIPPVITRLFPIPGSTMVPTHKTNLVFTFDEYVVVKDAQSIFLSPPLEKPAKYRMKGKSLVVYFENDLDSGKTYVMDLTNAVADNNEGNMFPGYALAFSTGPEVDSMMITGVVQDCNTLMPVKGATVMLYKDHSDSAVFKSRPDAAAKTDDWGFFCVRNIKDTLYRMYAVMDANHDNMYQAETEKIAFADSLVRPTIKINDSIPELAKLLMKDTLACLARKTEYELNLFKETPSKQMIVNKERVGERTAYITFMAPDAIIDSLWIKGVRPDKLITQFNLTRDSLEIWINDPKLQPDTLILNVDYMKTDTLGRLVPFLEQIKLAKPKESKAKKSGKKDIKKEDTTTVFTVSAEPERVEQYGFEIEFKYPLVKSAFDSIRFWYVNPKQQEFKGKFTLEKDSLNLRKFVVRPSEKFIQGYEYFLNIPKHKFMDINGFYNDSLEVKVSLPTDENLSSLSLELTDVNNKYIIDLLNEKRDNVLRSYTVDKDCSLLFPYLKAGKYSIRIIEDLNRNGMVDTGNLLGKKQPEKVKFYKLKDGTFLLDIPEKTELGQTINVGELFR